MRASGTVLAAALAGVAMPGCAPMITLPPPVPLPPGLDELGVAGEFTHRYEVSPHRSTPSELPYGVGDMPSPALDLWYRHGWEGVDGGVVIRVDRTVPDPPAIGVGVNVSSYTDQGEVVVTGVRVQAGLPWLALGLPVLVRPVEPLWIWIVPSGGPRMYGLGRLGLGILVTMGPVALGAEGDLSFAWSDQTWDMFFLCGEPCPLLTAGAYAGAHF